MKININGDGSGGDDDEDDDNANENANANDNDNIDNLCRSTNWKNLHLRLFVLLLLSVTAGAAGCCWLVLVLMHVLLLIHITSQRSGMQYCQWSINFFLKGYEVMARKSLFQLNRTV